MTALAWERNDGYNQHSGACGVCDSRKVKWWPTIAGWDVPSDRLLETRLGCCDGCRDEWERIWKRKGKA